MADTPPTEATRAIPIGAQPAVTPVLRKRYAVIVGISEYQHPDLNLRYAHRDAEELYKLLLTPRGGGFPEKNIVKLIDEEATTRELTRALRSFLQRAGREDLVLIYLACHGAPDPNRPQNVYLITHDTDPKDIPGTALPMEHIRDALEPRNLYAKRVVLIADTCNSGAVGDSSGRRAVIDESAAARRYLHRLGESKPGMAILTSAEVNETSREDARWGGGHGVFTWHLLEGLRGKAENSRGEVTIRGLFDYVQEQVRADTGDQQHPVIGATDFDRDLPLAVTGDISTNEYFQLGRALLEMGWLLDDKERFASAERHLREAQRLAGELGQKLPEAHLLIGQSRLAAGDATGALTALDQAIQGLNGESVVEAGFYRAMACAVTGDKAATLAAVTDFLQTHPDDWRAAWLRTLSAEIQADEEVTSDRALLIGISEYADSERIPHLPGPINDVRLAQEMLVNHFGFSADNIVLLENEKATRQGILDELARLAEHDGVDRVVVWFSGHAYTSSTPTYLMPWDYDIEFHVNGITAEELHAGLKAIPSASTVAVLDTHGREELFALAARDQAYLLLIAEDGPHGTAQDVSIDGRGYGLFSHTLVQAISQAPHACLEETFSEIIWIVREKSAGRQVPLLVGDGKGPLLEKADWRLYGELFLFSQRRNYDAITATALETLQRRMVTANTGSFPPFYHSLGRGYLDKEAFSQAVETLQVARQQAEAVGYGDPTLLLSLAVAQLRSHRYAEALDTLQHYQQEIDDESGLEEAVAITERLTNRKLHGLIVGVGSLWSPDLPSALGALNDADSIDRLLVGEFGADKDDVIRLVDEKATAKRIRDEFRRLLDAAKSNPAFFYFAGNGSLSSRGEPTLLPYDARSAPIPNDITLRELAEIAAQQPNNLVSLIDAGWAEGDVLPWGAPSHSRYVRPDVRPLTGSRSLDSGGTPNWKANEVFRRPYHSIGQRLEEEGLAIGHPSLYPASIQATIKRDNLPQGIAVAEADFFPPSGEGSPRPQGVLTYSFIRAVLQLLDEGKKQNETTEEHHTNAAVTYGALMEAIAAHLKWLQPFALGLRPAETLFSNVIQEEEVQRAIRRRIFERPLHQVAELSSRLLDRRDGEEMEAWLNLGIAQAAQKEYSQSIRSLQEAIKREESGLPELCAEAHYHLGRVLTITASSPAPVSLSMTYGEERPGDLDTAISELRDAIRRKSDDGKLPHYWALAHYWLGEAIFTRVQQEQLVEAEEAWKRYLDLGAPAGHRAEVRRRLERLRGTGRGTGSG